MIVIIGCSWGCGEWATGFPSKILHKGLEQYLKDSGRQVVNLSTAGFGNFQAYYTLKQFLQSGVLQHLPTIEHVLCFQTDWTRDYQFRTFLPSNSDIKQVHWYCPNNINQVKDIYDLRSKTISAWQYRLSDLAKEYGFKVGLIGGASDTIWLDRFSDEYTDLEIICQSMTNLCINDNHRIVDPVLQINLDLFHEMKNLLDLNDLDKLVDLIQNSLDRLNTWRNHKAYFYPDGNHANRVAHKKLFDFILDSGFLTA